jgi:hypothetical protein
MKVELTDHGVLEISGDNLLESMALTTWHESWKRREAGLRVHVVKPATEPVAIEAPTAAAPLDDF